MAKSKDDIKYGTAQAKLSEDETLRVAYKSGTPLEGGKIADSQPVDLFSAAQNIANQQQQQQNKGVIAESEPVDLFSTPQGVVQAKDESPATSHNISNQEQQIEGVIAESEAEDL